MTAERGTWNQWPKEAETLLTGEDWVADSLNSSGYRLGQDQFIRAREVQAYALGAGWVVPTGAAVLAVLATEYKKDGNKPSEGVLFRAPQWRYR